VKRERGPGNQRRGANAALLAVLASLALHVAFAAALTASGTSTLLLREGARRVPRDEVVAISEPVTIERAKSPVERAFARFDLTLRGRRARLRRGQGTYAPVASWLERGKRYYRVAYAFVEPDGSYESGIVPWPVTFAPGEDPFIGVPGRPRALTALPPPPPGYMPPGTLGKALRAYFPDLRFED